jgi:excinuclease UvrABC nuclease subunit
MSQRGLFMKYFVLRPSMKDWHGKASIAALETYMQQARESGQAELAEDLRTWIATIKSGLSTG